MNIYAKFRLVLFLLPFTYAFTEESPVFTLRHYAEYDDRATEKHIVKQVDNHELIILVSKPDGWQKSDSRSGMLWIHGGGWISGNPEQFSPQIRYSASRGAVGFSLQYRLLKNPVYKKNKKLSDEENERLAQEEFAAFIEGLSIADCIEDCKDAVNYIKENAHLFGVNPNKLVAIGDSAGSHLAACLGTVVEDAYKVNAVVACSSISDLTYEFGRDYIKPSQGYENKNMEDDPDRLRRARAVSPFYHLSGKTPPFLILDGGKDWLKNEPKRFYKQLINQNIDAEYKQYPQAKHAFLLYAYSASLEEITQAILDIDAFLVKYGFLEGEPTIKMPESAGEGFIFYETDDLIHGEKTFDFERDIPSFFSISMQVKLPKDFKGELICLEGTWGFRYKIRNNNHELSFLRGRMRGRQKLFQAEVWQDFTISMTQEKISVEVDGVKAETVNTIGASYAGSKLTLLRGIDAKIRDFKIISK